MEFKPLKRVNIIFTLIIMLSGSSQAQDLIANTCDSTILSETELEKCRSDRIYDMDISARSNYIVFIKTELLPAYLLRRKSLSLEELLIMDLRKLKLVYDSTLTVKQQAMLLDADKYGKYVQPKSYITSLLSLEIFKFYPDIFAVVLNPIHQNLNPKSDPNKIREIEQKVRKIYTSLDPELKKEVEQITFTLDNARKAWKGSSYLDMFQGAVTDDLRKEYSTVNFLLWTE